jgi:hypothetical protein
MNLERGCFFAVAVIHLIFIIASQPQETLENGIRIRYENINPITSWHSGVFENSFFLGFSFSCKFYKKWMGSP